MIHILLLAAIGVVSGAAINWAIYQWAIWQHRPISPWMRPRPERIFDPEDVEQLSRLVPRSGLDFVPVLGWFRLRRDAAVFGTGCWIRPLLIELSWMIGLPLFYLWQQNGGLLEVNPARLVPAAVAQFPSLATTWFWVHSLLIGLLFIATFIDFDEQMIPDQVTVPGTLAALLIAVLVPASRLPLLGSVPAGMSVSSLDFAAPNPLSDWHLSFAALLTCLAVYCVWIWGLLPKIIPRREFGLGITGSLKIMLASIFRPPRANSCSLRTTKRQMYSQTRLYLVMGILGLIAIAVGWFLIGPEQNLSLVSAFIGLAVAGGLIWGIRIVGGFALGQQAMGFGDVTLMCMIGAFLGWQAAVAAFVFSIMFAVVFAIALLIITRNSYLAFGPYLCMGALMVMLRWPATWTGFAQPVFWWGPWLIVWLAACLLMMAVLLPMVRWLKEATLGEATVGDE